MADYRDTGSRDRTKTKQSDRENQKHQHREQKNGPREPSAFDKRTEKLAQVLNKTDGTRSQEIGLAEVKDLRAITKAYTLRSEKQSEKTVHQYEIKANRLNQLEKTPESHAGSRHSFDIYRAAVVRDAALSAKTALTDRDRAVKSKNLPAKADAELRLSNALTVLQAYPIGERNHTDNFARDSRYQGPVENGFSRRDHSADLPKGWQEKVFDGVTRHDRPKVAILAVTGCRPAELCNSKGVHLKALENGGLEITRHGAKVNEKRGIALIKTSYSPEQVKGDRQTQYLFDLAARTKTGETIVREKGSENALSKRISNVSQREIGDRCTAYDYRHAKASRSKTEGQSRAELAKELGQRSERSPASYGKTGGCSG